MDTRLEYQKFIKDILLEHTKYKPAFGDINSRVLFSKRKVKTFVFQTNRFISQ
ncbi:hypothetical protein [Candidatus Parabeggiatoa sp. HSG14]|uniref:hypothetical protein n=1 Tax=Candidatus Parabeggiatoa sp. HSG14 TaxID=3055593 RepID=UPI0025A8F41A|nr:hypothetical protein [Thiotrichales bacterium HSG14]